VRSTLRPGNADSVDPGVGDARHLTSCRQGQRGGRDIIRDAKRSAPCGSGRCLGRRRDRGRWWGPDEADCALLVTLHRTRPWSDLRLDAVCRDPRSHGETEHVAGRPGTWLDAMVRSGTLATWRSSRSSRGRWSPDSATRATTSPREALLVRGGGERHPMSCRRLSAASNSTGASGGPRASSPGSRRLHPRIDMTFIALV
jgi:hypothetical protein